MADISISRDDRMDLSLDAVSFHNLRRDIKAALRADDHSAEYTLLGCTLTELVEDD